MFTSRYFLRARTPVVYFDKTDEFETVDELDAAYVPSSVSDDEEDEVENVEEGGEGDEKEESNPKAAAMKPKPAKKSTKKATKKGEVRLPPKIVLSREQRDKKNKTRVKKALVASGGHGNVGRFKSYEFLKNYPHIKVIKGLARRSMLPNHWSELFERFDSFLLMNKKVEEKTAWYSAEFPRVPLFTKKRSANAQRVTPVLKVGGCGAKSPVALRVLLNDAKEFWLVAMFESVTLAERMMGSGETTIVAALKKGHTGLSGKYLGDLCHWRRMPVS